MTKRYVIALTVLLGVLSFNSCTSDDDDSSEVHDLVQTENVYLEFNQWIYAQMNHDYLWRNDMPDSLSCDYNLAPVDFYKSLLSPKDRFSYCETNNSYNPPKSENQLGYEYQLYELGDGSEFAQVLLVTNPQLRAKGLKRGDVVICQPDQHIIVRGKLGQNGVVPTDTLEAKNPLVDEQTVYLDSIYDVNSSKTGYLCYLKFNAIDDLVPVIKKFYDAGIDELILDLRYNPGGYVNTCKYLSNSIVNERGYDGIFQQCTYNDVLTREMKEKTGSGISVNRFSTPDNGANNSLGNPMYGLNLQRVFVLTSKNSASASEAAIISMRPYMDVVIIGEQTYGKGVGSWTIRDNRYKYQLQPITMRYHNALMETTPDEGLEVDYYVPDGYSTAKKELGDIKEPLLAKALSLIAGSESRFEPTPFDDIQETTYHVKKKGLSSVSRFIVHQ